MINDASDEYGLKVDTKGGERGGGGGGGQKKREKFLQRGGGGDPRSQEAPLPPQSAYLAPSLCFCSLAGKWFFSPRLLYQTASTTNSKCVCVCV